MDALHNSRLRKGTIITLMVIASIQISHSQMLAQHPQRDTTFWIFQRKPLVSYGLVGYSVGVFFIQYQWWWKGNYHPFHVIHEGFFDDYSLGVDKVGHFYTSYAYFLGLYDVMKWGGYDDDTAFWTGLGLASFHAVASEIADGFSNFGFAPDDLFANILGLGYAYAQLEVPLLRDFTFKWSYYPSDHRPRNQRWRVTNDYDGHFYWLSVNVHNILPETMKPYWPKFLNLAVGYGGRNVSYRNVGPQYRKFAVSLDYNLASIPTPDDTWDTLKRIFDRFHYPAPAVKKVGNEPVQFKPLLLY